MLSYPVQRHSYLCFPKSHRTGHNHCCFVVAKGTMLSISQSHFNNNQLYRLRSQVSTSFKSSNLCHYSGKYKYCREDIINRLSCMVKSEKSRGGTVSLLRGIIIFMASIIWWEGVSFFTCWKKQTTSSRKTRFMTFGHYNPNGLLGLSAAGISVFFIDNVPLLKLFGVK